MNTITKSEIVEYIKALHIKYPHSYITISYTFGCYASGNIEDEWTLYISQEPQLIGTYLTVAELKTKINIALNKDKTASDSFTL
jgi:hypothetical protein